jgi:glycosyltransferase involved in cell wall biosynthesis
MIQWLTAREGSSVFVAADIPDDVYPSADPSTRIKSPGELRVVFVSRLSRKKNLDYALSVLRGVQGRISFDIYGPCEDAIFWDECQRIIASLPERITVRYHGPIAHDAVRQAFSDADVFLFPSRSENYGHVVIEALGAGCAVVVSDQTYWRGLASHGIGVDLPLSSPAEFTEALQRFVAFDEGQMARVRTQARAFARAFVSDERPVRATAAMLWSALGVSPPN